MLICFHHDFTKYQNPLQWVKHVWKVSLQGFLNVIVGVESADRVLTLDSTCELCKSHRFKSIPQTRLCLTNNTQSLFKFKYTLCDSEKIGTENNNTVKGVMLIAE